MDAMHWVRLDSRSERTERTARGYRRFRCRVGSASSRGQWALSDGNVLPLIRRQRRPCMTPGGRERVRGRCSAVTTGYDKE
jgi:hypothetical protein